MKILTKILLGGSILLVFATSHGSRDNSVPNPFAVVPPSSNNPAARSLESINGKTAHIPTPDSVNRDINAQRAAQQAQAAQQQQRAIAGYQQQLAQQQVLATTPSNNTARLSSPNTHTSQPLMNTEHNSDTQADASDDQTQTDTDNSNANTTHSTNDHNDDTWGITY